MNGKTSFLLDTNIILGFLNGSAVIDKYFRTRLAEQPLYISQITKMELLGFPNISTHEETSLKEFLSLVETLAIDNAVCDKTIELRRHTRLKLPDAIIAATAIVHNFTLVTCDTNLANSTSKMQCINPCSQQ